MAFDYIEISGGKVGRIQLNVWGIIEFGDEFVNYGSFPPALAEMLKTYNIDNLVYHAAYGEWNGLWSQPNAFRPTLPAGEWISGQPSSSSNALTLRERWSAFVKESSSLFGGAMGTSFSRLHPFPVQLSPSVQRLVQAFQHSSASAEALTKWKQLLWGVLSEKQAKALTKQQFHAVPWYSFRLEASVDRMTSNHSLCAEFLWFEPRTDSLPALLADEAAPQLSIQRVISEKTSGLISILTILANPFPWEMSLRCVQAFPDPIRPLYDTLSTAPQRSEMSPFQFSYSLACDVIHRPSPGVSSADKYPCASTLYFDVSLAPHSAMNITVLALKQVQGIRDLPPDASHGSILPPLLVMDRNANESWTFSRAALLPAAIPDLSMPYTVYTLLSTLLAFMLGSLVNIYVRRVTARKQGNKQGQIIERDGETVYDTNK